MGVLFDRIRRLVMEGRYIVGEHASERLDERCILEWQVVDGIESGQPLRERPNDLPNPAVEVREVLADGTRVVAVWSYLISGDMAKLVTVYFRQE